MSLHAFLCARGVCACLLTLTLALPQLTPPHHTPSIGEEDAAAASLPARCQARRLIMGGDMAAAVALLQVREGEVHWFRLRSARHGCVTAAARPYCSCARGCQVVEACTYPSVK